MNISPKARAIIQELLARHRISVYEIEAISEGKELPGSSYPGELKSMSGYVTIPTSVYEFWFNWKGDHYTLGEENGSWQENAPWATYSSFMQRDVGSSFISYSLEGFVYRRYDRILIRLIE